MANPAYIDSDGVLTDGEAWVGIATTTLGSDTASITFTSTDDGQVGDFSQYMDLVAISYVRSDRVADSDWYSVLISGDTAASAQYVTQKLRGNGSGASAATYTYGGDNYGCIVGVISAADAVYSANIFASVVTTFFDVNSGKYKSLVGQSAADWDGGGEVNLWAGTHKKQAPITSIKFYPSFGTNLKDGSTISLFGVLPRMVAP